MFTNLTTLTPPMATSKCSPAQATARKRNYALFTLKGMEANLSHLEGQITSARHTALHSAIVLAIKELKSETSAKGEQNGTT